MICAEKNIQANPLLFILRPSAETSITRFVVCFSRGTCTGMRYVILSGMQYAGDRFNQIGNWGHGTLESIFKVISISIHVLFNIHMDKERLNTKVKCIKELIESISHWFSSFGCWVAGTRSQTYHKSVMHERDRVTHGVKQTRQHWWRPLRDWFATNIIYI